MLRFRASRTVCLHTWTAPRPTPAKNGTHAAPLNTHTLHTGLRNATGEPGATHAFTRATHATVPRTHTRTHTRYTVCLLHLPTPYTSHHYLVQPFTHRRPRHADARLRLNGRRVQRSTRRAHATAHCTHYATSPRFAAAPTMRLLCQRQQHCAATVCAVPGAVRVVRSSSAPT